MQGLLPESIFASTEESLVLSGPPNRLTGRLELRNLSSTRLVLRGARFRDPSGMLFARQLQQLLPSLVLRPEQGRSVPLSVSVDPTTPPGVYQIELEIGGQIRPAVLHVTEVFSLSLRPPSIIVMNQPGVDQRKRVVVANTGNVAFTVGDIGDVELKDDLAWERAIRIAVEPLSERADVDVEKIVVAVLDEVRNRDRLSGRAFVRVAGGPVEVRPGETVPIDLDVSLPDDLSRNRRYRGRAPLLTQDLEIVVVPSGEPLEDKLLPPPEVAPTEQVPEEPSEQPAESEKKARRRSKKS